MATMTRAHREVHPEFGHGPAATVSYPIMESPRGRPLSRQSFAPPTPTLQRGRSFSISSDHSRGSSIHSRTNSHLPHPIPTPPHFVPRCPSRTGSVYSHTSWATPVYEGFADMEVRSLLASEASGFSGVPTRPHSIHALRAGLSRRSSVSSMAASSVFTDSGFASPTSLNQGGWDVPLTSRRTCHQLIPDSILQQIINETSPQNRRQRQREERLRSASVASAASRQSFQSVHSMSQPPRPPFRVVPALDLDATATSSHVFSPVKVSPPPVGLFRGERGRGIPLHDGNSDGSDPTVIPPSQCGSDEFPTDPLAVDETQSLDKSPTERSYGGYGGPDLDHIQARMQSEMKERHADEVRNLLLPGAPRPAGTTTQQVLDKLRKEHREELNALEDLFQKKRMESRARRSSGSTPPGCPGTPPSPPLVHRSPSSTAKSSPLASYSPHPSSARRSMEESPSRRMAPIRTEYQRAGAAHLGTTKTVHRPRSPIASTPSPSTSPPGLSSLHGDSCSSTISNGDQSYSEDTIPELARRVNGSSYSFTSDLLSAAARSERERGRGATADQRPSMRERSSSRNRDPSVGRRPVKEGGAEYDEYINRSRREASHTRTQGIPANYSQKAPPRTRVASERVSTSKPTTTSTPANPPRNTTNRSTSRSRPDDRVAALNQAYEKFKKDPEDYLGVLELDCTKGELDSKLGKAHRAACLKYHPDKWASESEQVRDRAQFIFNLVRTAHEALQEPSKRSRCFAAKSWRDMATRSGDGKGMERMAGFPSYSATRQSDGTLRYSTTRTTRAPAATTTNSSPSFTRSKYAPSGRPYKRTVAPPGFEEAYMSDASAYSESSERSRVYRRTR